MTVDANVLIPLVLSIWVAGLFGIMIRQIDRQNHTVEKLNETLTDLRKLATANMAGAATLNVSVYLTEYRRGEIVRFILHDLDWHTGMYTHPAKTGDSYMTAVIRDAQSECSFDFCLSHEMLSLWTIDPEELAIMLSDDLTSRFIHHIVTDHIGPAIRGTIFSVMRIGNP